MVLPGTLFSYLAAFITIVVAIALGDLAMSLHRLLRARRRVRWGALPLLAALFVLLSLLTLFFELWTLTRLEAISYFALAWMLVPPVLTFLAASAVLPDEVPSEGLDLDAFYFGERRYIWGVLALAFAADIADGLVSDNFAVLGHPEYLWRHFAPLNALAMGAFIALWISARPWVHWLGLTALLGMAALGFTPWTVGGASAVDHAPAAAVSAPAPAAPTAGG